MPAICLSRSKHLLPFVALLKQAGEPVDRKLSQTRLPGHCLEDPETVIPAEQLFHFRELCGQALVQDDIGLKATRDLQISSLGEFGKSLLAAPTLYRLLTTLRDHLNTQSTVTEIELRRLDSGDVTFCYRFDHLPEKGVWHSDLYTFGWMSKIIRLVVPTWSPANIWSMSSPSTGYQKVFESEPGRIPVRLHRVFDPLKPAGSGSSEENN